MKAFLFSLLLIPSLTMAKCSLYNDYSSYWSHIILRDGLPFPKHIINEVIQMEDFQFGDDYQVGEFIRFEKPRTVVKFNEFSVQKALRKLRELKAC